MACASRYVTVPHEPAPGGVGSHSESLGLKVGEALGVCRGFNIYARAAGELGAEPLVAQLGGLSPTGYQKQIIRELLESSSIRPGAESGDWPAGRVEQTVGFFANEPFDFPFGSSSRDYHKLLMGHINAPVRRHSARLHQRTS
jgi:hypothetical protein